MWLGALLLLLGTVGVLVTARIALAVLLAVGPVFVIFALFPGTRGLTAGWLRGVVLTAVMPLFVVVGGGLMIELVVPVVAALRGAQGIDGRASLALFMIAAVHIALMGMVLKVIGAMVTGWDVFGLGGGGRNDGRDQPIARQPDGAAVLAVSVSAPASAVSPRRASVLAAASAGVPADGASVPPAGSAPSSSSRRTVVNSIAPPAQGLPLLPQQRARGIGSRFAARPNQLREMIR